MQMKAGAEDQSSGGSDSTSDDDDAVAPQPSRKRKAQGEARKPVQKKKRPPRSGTEGAAFSGLALVLIRGCAQFCASLVTTRDCHKRGGWLQRSGRRGGRRAARCGRRTNAKLRGPTTKLCGAPSWRLALVRRPGTHHTFVTQLL